MARSPTRRSPSKGTTRPAPRRGAKARARRSPSPFERLFLDAVFAVFVNRGDRVAMVNPACLRLFGAASKEDLIGRPVLELFHPEEWDAIRARIARVRETGRPSPLTPTRAVRRDGTVVPVEATGSPFSDGSGEAIHVVLLDATDRQRYEESLRLARDHFEALIAASPAAIVSLDVDGKVTFWNEGAERLFGWTASEVVGGPVPFVAPDQAAESAAMRRTVLSGQPLHGVELTRVRKDGRPVEISLSTAPLPGPDGTPIGVMGVITDVTERNRALRALRESEEQYRTEFEHASAGRCLVSPEGRIFKANRALAEMLGTTPEALVGTSTDSLIHPEHREEATRLGLQLLAGERGSVRFEARFLRANGGEVWVDVGTALYRHADGTPKHFITDAQDITARRVAEAESRRRGERLASLAQALRDLARGRSAPAIVEIAKRAARGLVAADGASVVLRDGDLCHYVDEDSVAPLWKGRRFPLDRCVSGWTMRTGSPAAIPDAAADARIPWEEYQGTFVRSLAMVPFGRDAGQGAIGVYWAARHETPPEEIGLLQALADATSVALENVATLDRLRRSEERYRKLVENLDDIVYSIDVEGRIRFVSSGVGRFGYTPAELMGARFLDFTHPEDRPWVEAGFAARLAADLEPLDYRVLDRSGRVRYVRSSSRRDFEDGQLVGLLGVLFDLTTKHETEEALRGAQKMEAVGRLAGGVAHDFNNILTVISSYAALAMRGLRQDAPLRVELEEIRKAADRASSLTRQLLAFSRRQVLQPAVLDLNALVSGIERMLRRLIGEDVTLRFVPGADLAPILADPGQVEQVLMNLVVNARDAMPTGGALTLSTANADLDEDFVRTHPGAVAGPHVMLAVADTGSGMDAGTLARIFEPFFTTKPAGKGTGLGLATVYGIVKQSGGGIWAESEPGKGSTFRVYFPRAPGVPVEQPAPPAPGPSAATATTLLLVEDDPALRTLAERILTEAGYRVLCAADGGEGLRIAEQRRDEIGLVLTDVVMPGMGGRELVTRLRPLVPNAAVLFMSGYTDEAIARHGVLEPGRRLLAKPFTPESLLDAVREALTASEGSAR